MCEEGAAEHRHFGVGVALEGFERQGHAHRRAITEVRALGDRQLHVVQIGAARDQLHFGELAVALQERPHARVWTLGLLGLFGGRAPSCHAASTEMSTSAIGRCSTCATSVMARPELVRPVSRTSAPYWG